MPRNAVVLCVATSLVLAIGCRASTTPADGGADAGGGGNDADVRPDAGADATPGLDAASDVDAGIDCSTIGCGAPPICGAACDAPCGCCPCGDGTEMGSYVCEGGCWAPRGTGTSGDPCAATSDCGSGLSCCYPCGIPGCTNQCMPTCSPGEPGCTGGCLAFP